MPHKKNQDSKNQQNKRRRLDDECHRITVLKLLACKVTGRWDLGPTPEQTQKAIQRLKDVAFGATVTEDGAADDDDTTERRDRDEV